MNRKISKTEILLLIGLMVFGPYLNPGPAHAAVQPPKNKYKRSRLTSDESEALADRRKMRLTTGEDRAVDLDFDVNGGAGGIEIGNPLLVKTSLVRAGDKRQIVFHPLKSGETTVYVRDNDGTIRLIFGLRVVGTNLTRMADEIKSLLRDVEGIDIRIVGPKIVIEGEVIVPSDYGRLFTIVEDKSYKDFILNLATLSPLALQALAKKIQDDIVVFAPHVTARVVNGTIFLEGSVENKDTADRAVQLATFYLPAIKPAPLLDKDQSAQRFTGRVPIKPFIAITPAPPKKQEKLVRVTVHFVELAKEYNKAFSFSWRPGFTSNPQISVGQAANGQAGASVNGTNGPTFSGTISSLLPQLSSSQAAGYARILRTGTVVVRSGQPAKLVNQTSIPFVQQASNGQASSGSANIGTSVAVTPLILGQSDDIQMDLDLDQTSLQSLPASAGAAPTTASNKVTTKVYIKSNESAAIAGLNAADITTDFNKDPAGGSFSQGTIPLFTLLRSKSYQKKKSQLVIFVTPQIVESASEGTEDLKRNFRVKVK